MKKFKLSEIIFMLFGFFLMASSVFLLHYNISLVRVFNLHRSPGDPFQASYYTNNEPAANASGVPTPTPSPTPLPVVADSTKPRIYLVSPLGQAVINRPKKRAIQPQKIAFKFEVYPKDVSTTFELLFKDKVIYSDAVSASLSGLHELSVEIGQSGVYQWRVKSVDITSELRNFTLRD